MRVLVPRESQQLVLVCPQNRFIELHVDIEQDVIEIDNDVLLSVSDYYEEASLFLLGCCEHRVYYEIGYGFAPYLCSISDKSRYSRVTTTLSVPCPAISRSDRTWLSSALRMMLRLPRGRPCNVP